MNLEGKRILIIITGGIAAYKMNTAVRGFIKEGAEVKVILTPAAKDFVTPLTLSVLSRNEVLWDLSSSSGTWNNHVELALWSDAILVAPCTANTLSKMVHGACDNLAMAVYMSAKCPVFIAPAMDLDMYRHPSTRQNIQRAQDFGHILIPAEEGELASGLHGEGRMAEPEHLIETVRQYFESQDFIKNMAGKKVLITAGPTYEAIDPVRFIGNHSSGKMGFALAEEAAKRGADVILISGPSHEKIKGNHIQLIRVTSAKEMFQEVFRYFSGVDMAIASAAVADYAPKEVAAEKIKKDGDSMTIELVKNPDILKTMGEQKKKQFLIGFALETQNEEAHAKEKLHRKNLDMIVLNSLRDSGAGFQTDTNRIRIFTEIQEKEFPIKPKSAVAADILDFAVAQMAK